MNACVLEHMVTNEEAENIWKNSKRRQIRVNVPEYIADIIDQKASSSWPLDNAARAKEVTRWLLEALESLDTKKNDGS